MKRKQYFKPYLLVVNPFKTARSFIIINDHFKNFTIVNLTIRRYSSFLKTMINKDEKSGGAMSGEYGG